MPLLLTLTSDLDLDDDQVMTQVVGSTGLTIGRGLDNDWIIKDPRRLLSKHHCRLDASGATFIITDTSTNGVFLNESPAPVGRGNTAVVSDGDRLRLGELDVVVQAIPEADAVALAGLSADPFASRSEPGSPGLGAHERATPGDEDPWGGWVPPGGQGGEEAGGPFDRPHGLSLGASLNVSLRSSGTGFEADGRVEGTARDGPMPPGDSLFGKAPGASADPWGDDGRDDGGDQWALAGADADDAAPEALAFVPAAAPPLTSADALPDGADDVPPPASKVAGGGLIPEDWDTEMEDLGIADESLSRQPVNTDLDPATAPPPIPTDEKVDLFVGRSVRQRGEAAYGTDPDESGSVPTGVTPIPEDFDVEAVVTPAGDVEPGPASMEEPLLLKADALMAVFDACLATFAPMAIEGRLPSLGDPDAMPPAVRQARAWAAYEARYPDLKTAARRRLAEALGIDPPAEQDDP